MARKYSNYSVYRNPRSPFWYGNVKDEYAKGGRHRFPTEVEATEENEELALDIARAEYLKRLKKNKLEIVEKQRLTLKESYGTYLSYEGGKLAPGSRMGVESSYAALSDYFSGNMLLDEINQAGMAGFMKDIKKIDKKTKLRGESDLAPATKNRYIDVFSSVLSFLEDFNISLPQIKFGKLKLKGPDSKENDISLMQLEILLRELKPHQRPIILFAVLTGLRKASVLSLKWEQINLFSKTINLKAKSRKKGGKNITVPISGGLESLLISLNAQPEGYVFLYKGQPIKDTKTSFNKAKSRAGLDFLTFHGLRHTFGCFLIGEADLKAVQDAMHHEDPRTTLRYARRKQEKLREQINNNSNFAQIGHTMKVAI